MLQHPQRGSAFPLAACSNAARAMSQGYALKGHDLVDNVTCINRSSLQKQVLSIR